MDLIIVGAGSVGGHIALNFKEYESPYNLIGFVDDDPDKQDTLCFGYKVLGPVSSLLSMSGVAVVIGIAFPGVKSKIIEGLRANSSLSFPTLISPGAWISKDVIVEEGCVIYPGVSINYGCRIGSFVVINMNCAIGHNGTVGAFTSMAPGVNLGGHTKIGRAVELGIGACTRQGVNIGDNTIVGGQSMIVTSIPENSRVIGVPGKVVGINDKQN